MTPPALNHTVHLGPPFSGAQCEAGACGNVITTRNSLSKTPIELAFVAVL